MAGPGDEADVECAAGKGEAVRGPGCYQKLLFIFSLKEQYILDGLFPIRTRHSCTQSLLTWACQPGDAPGGRLGEARRVCRVERKAEQWKLSIRCSRSEECSARSPQLRQALLFPIRASGAGTSSAFPRQFLAAREFSKDSRIRAGRGPRSSEGRFSSIRQCNLRSTTHLPL